MSEHRHFILHKPIGYLSQFVFNQSKRKNKKLLGELYDFPDGIMAIGRLDKNSEGLLLLTTDGKESEAIRSKKIEKEYYVELDGEITNEAIELLKTGVEISLKGENYHTLPCQAKRLETVPVFKSAKPTKTRHRPMSWLSITLTEGKFRQVRKMTAQVGFPTLRLIRIRIGSVTLGKLPAGEVIEVENFNNR